MKRKICTLLSAVFVSLAVTSASVAGETPEPLRELPPLLRAVSDEPGVLSLAEGRALSRRIADVERDTGVKMIALIVTTVAPESTDAYVQRLVNHWKRHTHALDNGRFAFIVIAKTEREARIVPGPELTWVLRPLTASRLTENAPKLLRNDRYYEALIMIVDDLSRMISNRLRTAAIL